MFSGLNGASHQRKQLFHWSVTTGNYFTSDFFKRIFGEFIDQSKRKNSGKRYFTAKLPPK